MHQPSRLPSCQTLAVPHSSDQATLPLCMCSSNRSEYRIGYVSTRASARREVIRSRTPRRPFHPTSQSNHLFELSYPWITITTPPPPTTFIRLLSRHHYQTLYAESSHLELPPTNRNHSKKATTNSRRNASFTEPALNPSDIDQSNKAE